MSANYILAFPSLLKNPTPYDCNAVNIDLGKTTDPKRSELNQPPTGSNFKWQKEELARTYFIDGPLRFSGG